MQQSEILNASQEALRRNPMRTFLTMLGIVIGISAVIMIASIGQGAVQFITNELSVFGTNYFQITPGQGVLQSLASTGEPLTNEDAEAILEESGISNIESVAAFAFTSREITANDVEDSLLVYGVTSSSEVILKPDMIYGEFFNEIHDESADSVAVIGVDVAEDFFGPDTNPVGEHIRIDGQKYRILGVSQSSGSFAGSFFNNSVNIPLATLQTEITGDESVVEIDVSVEDENQLDQTIEEVEAFLRERRNLDEGDDNNFTITNFKEALGTIQTVTSLLTALIAGISAISLVVGGVGVMNIMLVTVTERTKEIGLLKAIGAKRRDILYQFLTEAVALTVAGGIIGIILGIAGAFVVSLVAGIPFVVSLPAIILAVGVSSLVGVLFGMYPARKAARLEPIEALRHE